MEQNIEGNPRAEIEAIRAEVMAMGANDSEAGDFDQISNDLNEGKITSDEALKRAHRIRHSKMDYH